MNWVRHGGSATFETKLEAQMLFFIKTQETRQLLLRMLVSLFVCASTVIPLYSDFVREKIDSGYKITKQNKEQQQQI